MKSQNGFVAAIVVFVVLALIVIGGIAYIHYIYLPKMAAQTNNPAQPTSTLTATITTTTITLPAGCVSATGYNAITGQSCSSTTPTSTVSKTALPSQPSTGSNGCGSNANCFIQATKICSPTTAIVSVKQPVDSLPFSVNLTERLSITGGKPASCLFTNTQTSATVEFDPVAYQAIKVQADAMLAQGQVTQQQYDAGLLQLKDASSTQAFWNEQIGVSYKCSIPSAVLTPIVQGLLIPQPWSATTTMDSNTGLDLYCQVSAPNLK
jgi:hypothetical protein